MSNDNKKYSAGKTIKRLIADLKPIAWAIIIATFVCVGSVLLAVYAPELVSNLTDLLYDYVKGGEPLDMQQVGKWCLELIAVYGASVVLSIVMVMMMTNITSNYFTRGMRIRITDKLQRLPVSFIDNTPNGELLSKMMDDVSNMSGSIHVILETIINGVVRIVIITVAMYRINVWMATAVVILVPFSIWLSTFISSKNESSWHNFREINDKMYAFIEEDFTGFETIKSFNMERRQKEISNDIFDRRQKKLEKCYYLSGLVQPIIALTDNIAYVAVCVLGGCLAVNYPETLSVGQIVEIILYAKMFAGPLESIANGFSSVNHTLACASRVYNLLDLPEMEENASNTLATCKGEVVFKDVCFSYDKEKPLIKNLNFTVKPGQKVALVGPTGGGKTTIVNLLMRFYDIDSGTITIDGVDTMTMDRADVRKQFSMVLQDTWLFNGTVYDNIAYGKADATQSEVMASAKQAYIDNFVDMLPEGYNTVINEESNNISGGQKQLMTIARSYLANGNMLILDEATSNVDTRTELLIQQTMDKLLENRTSFVIAHRLSTIVNADMILVVNNGEIVEQGTHDELMTKGGFYKEIYDSQYELLS